MLKIENLNDRLRYSNS